MSLSIIFIILKFLFFDYFLIYLIFNFCFQFLLAGFMYLQSTVQYSRVLSTRVYSSPGRPRTPVLVEPDCGYVRVFICFTIVSESAVKLLLLLLWFHHCKLNPRGTRKMVDNGRSCYGKYITVIVTYICVQSYIAAMI